MCVVRRRYISGIGEWPGNCRCHRVLIERSRLLPEVHRDYCITYLVHLAVPTRHEPCASTWPSPWMDPFRASHRPPPLGSPLHILCFDVQMYSRRIVRYFKYGRKKKKGNSPISWSPISAISRASEVPQSRFQKYPPALANVKKKSNNHITVLWRPSLC